jgi:hypothetical protein
MRVPSFLFRVAVLASWAVMVAANDYRDPNYVEYGDVTVDYPYFNSNGPPVCALADTGNSTGECLNPTDFVSNDFVVAGINLARYYNNRRAVSVPRRQTYNSYRQHSRPFLLYQDFDIRHMIHGNETWMDLLLIRRHLTRSTLSYYSDKVARKRWLKERGYPQPQLYFSAYIDELLLENPRSFKQEELAAAILPHIPTTRGFCAKPNHMVSDETTTDRDFTHHYCDIADLPCYPKLKT